MGVVMREVFALAAAVAIRPLTLLLPMTLHKALGDQTEDAEMENVVVGENPHQRPTGFGIGTAIDSGASSRGRRGQFKTWYGPNRNCGPCA